jgi:hypothetical protein
LGRTRETEREERTDATLRRSGILVVRPGDEGLATAWDHVVGATRRARGASRIQTGPRSTGRALR